MDLEQLCADLIEDLYINNILKVKGAEVIYTSTKRKNKTMWTDVTLTDVNSIDISQNQKRNL